MIRQVPLAFAELIELHNISLHPWAETPCRRQQVRGCQMWNVSGLNKSSSKTQNTHELCFFMCTCVCYTGLWVMWPKAFSPCGAFAQNLPSRLTLLTTYPWTHSLPISIHSCAVAGGTRAQARMHSGLFSFSFTIVRPSLQALSACPIQSQQACWVCHQDAAFAPLSLQNPRERLNTPLTPFTFTKATHTI